MKLKKIFNNEATKFYLNTYILTFKNKSNTNNANKDQKVENLKIFSLTVFFNKKKVV